MFNRDDKDPTGPMQTQQRPEWREPNLHTWIVQRENRSTDELEAFTVTAHGITHTTTDGIVFSRFYLDPVIGPQPVPVRAFADYYDYEDVTPQPEPVEAVEAVEESLIVTH